MTPQRLSRIETVLAKRQSGLTVVLENVFDPHNISAVMRTCDAVGVQEIFVLNTILPPHQKFFARTSSSAAKWLTVHQFTNTVACFNALRKNHEQILTTHLSATSKSLYQLDLAMSTALVFGNEKLGVTDEARALADGNFIIPQVGMIRSLNISVACAVTLYEAFRQKEIQGHYQQPSFSGAQLEMIREEWQLKNQEIRRQEQQNDL